MSQADALIAAIKNRTSPVAVIGLGYVGLPLSLALVQKGFPTVAVDIDERKIRQLDAGYSYISDIDDAKIAEANATGKFTKTTDFAALRSVKVIVICVPTPLAADNTPDLQFIKTTGESILPHLHRGQLVVLTSTSYPGTTREVLKPILERSGLQSGSDFLLAFSPEREDPGNISFATTTIRRIVGGDGTDALAAANALFSEIVVRTVPVSSMEVAEAANLTENIFRAINIALVNELKVIYEAMGIDVWDVIDAAKTKPFGFMPFYPGPGLGGHCIPIDPFYLSWHAARFGETARFIELAGRINTAMPERVIAKLKAAFAQRGQGGLAGRRVLLVGMAYKKNVNDMRESPALQLLELRLDAGADVEYFDPFVPEIPPTRRHPALKGKRSVAWTADVLGGFDAALICTDHDNVDYQFLLDNVPLLVDTRNAMRTATRGREKIVKA